MITTKNWHESTRELNLTIELDKYPNWWVDSFYVLHQYMHSHSGILMTLGKSATTETKQKGSTEADLVAIDNSWHKFFGLDTSQQFKVCMYQQQEFTKITKAPYYEQRMARDQIADACDIWIYDTLGNWQK